MNEVVGVLERIAAALERQVAQHDEAVARNLALRDENLQRHERERDGELAVVRRLNEDLLQRLDAVIKLHYAASGSTPEAGI